MILISRLVCGPLDVNTYIVREEQATACVLIDPADYGAVRVALTEKGLAPDAILLTHGHFDHLLGVKELKREYGCRVYIHELDMAGLMGNGRINLGYYCGCDVQPCNPDVLLKDGDIIEEAGICFNVIHTPGHSKGGVCYLIKDANKLFTGDTLFRMGVGRSDFPTSDSKALYASISDKIFSLSGDYDIFPGHMLETTLEHERRRNPYMTGAH